MTKVPGKQLEMECGTIISHVYNHLSFKDIHEFHIVDCETTGTVIVDNRPVPQTKINISANTLPEVIKFLQEAQRKHETT